MVTSIAWAQVGGCFESRGRTLVWHRGGVAARSHHGPLADRARACPANWPGQTTSRYCQQQGIANLGTAAAAPSAQTFALRHREGSLPAEKFNACSPPPLQLLALGELKAAMPNTNRAGITMLQRI